MGPGEVETLPYYLDRRRADNRPAPVCEKANLFTKIISIIMRKAKRCYLPCFAHSIE